MLLFSKGAVAFLVAMKLKKRGYNVSKVTAVAGARFCDPKDVLVANDLLPNDALRIEDDLDGVPFLPPWASGIGDKLWLVNKCDNMIGSSSLPKESATLYQPKYVPREVLVLAHGNDNDRQTLKWIDDCWTNIRIPEIVRVINRTHRISSHKEKLQQLIENESIHNNEKGE